MNLVKILDNIIERLEKTTGVDPAQIAQLKMTRGFVDTQERDLILLRRSAANMDRIITRLNNTDRKLETLSNRLKKVEEPVPEPLAQTVNPSHPGKGYPDGP